LFPDTPRAVGRDRTFRLPPRSVVAELQDILRCHRLHSALLRIASLLASLSKMLVDYFPPPRSVIALKTSALLAPRAVPE
jgi:hypothetical protein